MSKLKLDFIIEDLVLNDDDFQARFCAYCPHSDAEGCALGLDFWEDECERRSLLHGVLNVLKLAQQDVEDLMEAWGCWD